MHTYALYALHSWAATITEPFLSERPGGSVLLLKKCLGTALHSKMVPLCTMWHYIYDNYSLNKFKCKRQIYFFLFSQSCYEKQTSSRSGASCKHYLVWCWNMCACFSPFCCFEKLFLLACYFKAAWLRLPSVFGQPISSVCDYFSCRQQLHAACSIARVFSRLFLSMFVWRTQEKISSVWYEGRFCQDSSFRTSWEFFSCVLKSLENL